MYEWLLRKDFGDIFMVLFWVALIGGGLYGANWLTGQPIKVVSLEDSTDPESQVKKVIWEKEVTVVEAMIFNCRLPNAFYGENVWDEKELFVLGFESGTILGKGASRGKLVLYSTPIFSISCPYTVYY